MPKNREQRAKSAGFMPSAARASAALLAAAASSCARPRVEIRAAPTVTPTTVHAGQVVTASVTYENVGRAPSIGPMLDIEAVRPGGAPRFDPLDRRARRFHLGHGSGETSIAPGAALRVQGTFTPQPSDPPGWWRACPSYLEIHDARYQAAGPCARFRVLGPTQ